MRSNIGQNLRLFSAILAKVTHPSSASDILDKDPINVSLYILPCSLGLMLDFTSGDCVCDNDIVHISGVICNISWMPYPIQRSGNNWISYQYHNCTMVHTGCPFDYCNTASVKPVPQCSHTHSPYCLILQPNLPQCLSCCLTCFGWS